jgi:ribosomal protein S18 acetylase RimI-like enzyme
MVTLRAAQWPQDETLLRALDTTFVTEWVYRPVRGELSLHLVAEPITPPLRKRYEFDPADPEERLNWDFTIIAEDEGQLSGVAAAQHVAWNRRVTLWHLYVMPAFRRRGVGTRLLSAVDEFAVGAGARCIWLETQNVNVPAIRFYRRAGFRLCGFDDTLYDPTVVPTNEIALFFARPVHHVPPILQD